jgi:hypothetical protein
MRLNSDPVDFERRDMSYLVKKEYDAAFREKVSRYEAPLELASRTLHCCLVFFWAGSLVLFAGGNLNGVSNIDALTRSMTCKT